jgi:hypothetical protein
MAMANEVEDFVTCGVCLQEYDEEIRKPKFLQCTARHTACLLCLKVAIFTKEYSLKTYSLKLYDKIGNAPRRLDYLPFLSRYFRQV